MTDLAAEHEALLQFMYMCPAGILQAGLDGGVTMLNPMCVQMLLPIAPSGEMENLFDIFEHYAPELRNMSDSFAKPRGMIADGLRVSLNPGRSDQIAKMLSVSLVKVDADRLMAIISDVSEQFAIEQKLKESQAWFAAIASGVSDYAIMTLDSAGRIDSWNATGERLTGYAPVEVIGEPFTMFQPTDSITPDRMQDLLDRAEENGWSLDEGWRIKADGGRFWCSSMVAPLDPNVGNRGFSLIMRDITMQRQAAEDLANLARNDHLTGVANRRTFFDAVAQEELRWKRYPRPLSIVLIDADHFKKVNDTFGHHAGDRVLQNLAARARSMARDLDVVARLGGEEFAILLPSTDVTGAEIFADRLRRDIESQEVAVDDMTIRYTISLGVAELSQACPSVEAAMKQADAALYAAKRAGRNQVARAEPAGDS